MSKFKVIIRYSDGTVEELGAIHDDISMAHDLGKARLMSYEKGYKPSPDGHTLEDGCTAHYEIIEISK